MKQADLVPIQGEASKSKVAVTVRLPPDIAERLDKFRRETKIENWTTTLSRSDAIVLLVRRGLPEPPPSVVPIRARCEKGKGRGCMLLDGHLGMCKDGISDDD